ncbi:unnamed protein product [Cuscuta epithymum]|uniref:DDE Tnp4 domain-containing protein n=2 Tax=Cuscuta epithymum TaxID=186058 RepID=A0AAV0E951_9ASTE|nr:unnamed protein product [Cuscuta epithymum]
MSHSDMAQDNDSDMDEIEEDESREDMYRHIRYLFVVIQTAIYMLSLHIVKMHQNRVNRYSLARRPKTRDGYDYIHKILKEDPKDFRDIYRMYPDVFLKLCHIIREKQLLADTRYVSIEEMLATFLVIVGQNNRYCQLRKTFGRSHFTVSQNFNKVLKVLQHFAVEMMAKPGRTVPEKIRESTRFYPYFKECLGAIDGTHIPAMISGRETSSYRNRHGIISQNVLATCNFDLQFMYVLSGWEGSAHDSKVLTDALTRENGLKVPNGYFYLADCGYPNRRQFLAPFRGTRYHLQDFAGQGRDPNNSKELFNLRHASLRNVVERIFGIFKSRFVIFKTAPPFPFRTQAELVLACVGLHNFLRKECRSDEFPVDPEDEIRSFEAEDVEQYFASQEQQRANANAWRDTIASNMWNDAMN